MLGYILQAVICNSVLISDAPSKVMNSPLIE